MNALVTQDKSSPILFDVFERPVYFKGKNDSYYESPKHKAIVRMIGGEPVQIGMVGINYKVIKTRELCDKIEEEFTQVFSPEQISGAQVHDRASYHGGMCIRQYVFPKVATDINARSSIAFRIVIINGYDGSSSFKLYSGAIDTFCTNGMVTGSYDMMILRHTASLTIPRITETVKRSIDAFYTQGEVWKKWANKKITQEDAKKCFESLPNVSERRIEQLMHLFAIEQQHHGNTVWAMYSAATFYASHDKGDFTIRETGTDHRAATLLKREKDVMVWQESPEFMQLAA